MKKFSVPSAYTIAVIFIFLAAALTWILPSGSYNYKTESTGKVIPASKVKSYSGPERLLPVPNTYSKIKPSHQGITDILQAPIKGFYGSVNIVAFILCIGGFLGVMNYTKALDSAITNLILKLKGKENYLIAVLTILFGLGGASFGMAEETFAFFPLLIPILLMAGYDTFTSILIILLGSGLGCLASVVNPFAVGIASNFIEISIGDGIVTRIILFVVCIATAIIIILRYAGKVKKDPSKSIVADKKEELEAHFLHNKDTNDIPEFTVKRKIALTIFIGTFLVYIYAVIPFSSLGLTFIPSLGWSFTQMSTCFVTSSVIMGLCYRMREIEIIDNFLAGARDFLGVAIIIGIARGISIILINGLIIDTILHSSVALIKSYSSYTCLSLIYFMHIVLSLFITSTSGLATITMPIMGPLASFIHIPKDLVVTAYATASGLVNMFAPTSAVVMGCIIIGKIPYTRFLKYIIPKCLIFFFITLAVMLISLYVKLHF
ncbi:MAG: hypothetical protein K9M56_03945 [Victivallales bacterium]|nr:hypothetical protein [Victivallales bacterium]